MKDNEKNLSAATPAEKAPVDTSKDFVFVQQSEKLHDKKFQTKPTTFLKDALKRFAKSKSSVVAACFLGILIAMAIIVPITNQHNVSEDYICTNFSYLPPKWFADANGFLDGTQTYTDVVINREDGYPAARTPDTPGNYVADYIKGDISYSYKTMNTADVYGWGGSVRLVPGGTDFDFGGIYSPQFTLGVDSAYALDLKLSKTDCELSSSYQPNWGMFLLCDLDPSVEGLETVVTVKDYGTSYDDVSCEDLGALIKANPSFNSSGTHYIKTQLNIRIQNPKANPYPSLFVKSCEVKYAADPTLTEKIGFDSGNELILRDDETYENYGQRWRVNGDCSKFAANVEYQVGAFRYDLYAQAFGNVSKDIGKASLQEYIDKGWCSYDWDLPDDQAPSSFKVLSDECPVIQVNSQSHTTYKGLTSYTLNVEVSKAKFYGYKGLTYFVFGTDKQGRDYFKLLFSGLSTSLLLGVFSATINIFIGLVWGAVSGYFGGWTDILMERFTEILGGVPWIVVMTLCILHLGSNFWTFLLALCLTGWMGISGETRSQFYRYKGREYVLASRTLGASDTRLIFKHILPNGIGPVVTGAVLMIPSVIFSEATIAYLGLGLKGMSSFGVALSTAQGQIDSHPYMIICGSIITAILMISFNLFGNGLRDAFNPSLKGAQE